MDTTITMNDLLALLEGAIKVENGKVKVVEPSKLRKNIGQLARVSALETGERQATARYLTRAAALAVGVVPASIQDLYIARGRGDVPPVFTVPAMNLRSLSYDAAKAVFRVANHIDAGAFIFEIARSEMGYTDQRPSEYSTNILAAAIAESFRGPVFIQGDHFQVSSKRYESDPETELQTLRDLIKEALGAGFFNIDVDTSTLVDLSKDSLDEQQALNTELSAMFSAFIREMEPQNVTISIGGEIGEVGGQNSTEPELRTYMEGFSGKLADLNPDAPGLSKISIQTGTSHGGVVLPDGTIKEVAVDFDTLLKLSRIARKDYGLAGAVQHGASTLPEDAFGKFVESEACEVHLATNFQNILFDHLPGDLRGEMYAYLDQNHSDERKPGMTDEQFYYKSRKRAIGPFKAMLWDMDDDQKAKITQAWEKQFSKLFNLLAMEGTREFVEKTVNPAAVQPKLKVYLGEESVEEDVSDLAD